MGFDGVDEPPAIVLGVSERLERMMTMLLTREEAAGLMRMRMEGGVNGGGDGVWRGNGIWSKGNWEGGLMSPLALVRDLLNSLLR